MAVIDALEASVDDLCALEFSSLANPERVVFLKRIERVARRLAVPTQTLVQQLADGASPAELGGTSLADILSRGLSISRGEARRRIGEAEDLAPRHSLNGDPLTPRLEATAAAQKDGAIGAEHVKVIRGFLADLPTAVDQPTREAAEKQLADLARGLRPEGLRQCADRLSTLLNPDGEFSDADRARRRGLNLGRQGADGLSPITGMLDPEARAYLEAVLAKWAAPGMCDPNDQTPTVDGEPSPEATDRDTRSPLQRNHDAVKATLRAVLASGHLGMHRGLPVTVVVSTTLKDLQSGCGKAVTGGGSLLPISDLIRMAAHANHYLAVFDGHAERPLYLARNKRIASADQRVVLHAKDRGCSFPNCTVPGYLCETHHVDEWTDDGPTDIDNLTFACGPHHRLVKPGGWRTRKDRYGRTEWLSPPQLQMAPGSNSYHHPDRLLIEPPD
ncbi:MAG: HNH endonuclease signature motif containing protein [Mycobacterium sp.]